ncbi:hypothetical protein [Rhizobium rhizogenes]|uniref:hypothetical protein n=1 Tax=Rhizobium rhizogenes TaxID=359 RepID=UPI0004D6E2C8|nr:hypothetical protein [Rhizobium rhizogenes]KEA07143.1 hypothetical protein CN09_09365 [Rhizobium rhizogenes]NTI80421.1 hypothetical protein [Rhizobium rhizogenes]NTJ22607.1 hypothetical protein [Rhizobium rhizogenes]QUE81313.1 hypothetical protein EML492_05755 [Rhizobium rhizogenes]TQO80589.1 hypothetical protein FFE80_05670 [Rhizobium rhizogenes]
MSTPVLNTIRALLKFKAFTTIAEIASMSGLKRMDVLQVVNANLDLIKRDAKRGRIIGLDLEGPLRKQLWASGKFYRIGEYDAWSREGDQIVFEGNTELRERLSSKIWVGGIGDCYQATIILASETNIAAVEAEGIRPWSEAVIDDRLWKEQA